MLIRSASSALLLLLIDRNPEVSPWFGISAAALPVCETLYSIWRRSRSGMRTMEPDQSHLHQLVRIRLHWTRRRGTVRRMLQWVARRASPLPIAAPDAVRAPNGSASPVLWMLHAFAAGLGALTWHDTTTQILVIVAFALLYVMLHQRLCRSRIKYGLPNPTISSALPVLQQVPAPVSYAGD